MSDDKFLENLRRLTSEGVMFFVEVPVSDSERVLELFVRYTPLDIEEDMMICLDLQSSLIQYIAELDRFRDRKLEGGVVLFELTQKEVDIVLGKVRVDFINELFLCSEDADRIREVINILDSVISLNSPIVIKLHSGE